MNNVSDKPTVAGWYWWKATSTSSAREIKVSQQELEQSKYSRWGGEWHRFPSFDEVNENRKRINEIESLYAQQCLRMKKYEETFAEFVGVFIEISNTLMTPKKRIKDFLEELKKKSL